MIKARGGYTLIELLTVLTIISILFLLGFSSYNRFNQNQAIKEAAEQLKSNLILVRDKAAAGEKDCRPFPNGCAGVNDKCDNGLGDLDLDGWYVSFTANGYSIYGKCGDVTYPNPATTVDLSSKNISITNPPSNPIKFQPLNRGVEYPVTITLHRDGYEEKEVIVTQTGEIR